MILIFEGMKVKPRNMIYLVRVPFKIVTQVASQKLFNRIKRIHFGFVLFYILFSQILRSSFFHSSTSGRFIRFYTFAHLFWKRICSNTFLKTG